jgi:hypothetical protein
MPSTYTKISSTTLGSSAASVTFSSIPATYTDLVIVSFSANTAINGNGQGIRFNSDTATNYSKIFMYGDGTSAVSGRASSQTNISISNQPISSSGTFAATVTSIQNYSNSTTYKTVLSRGGSAHTNNLVIAYTGTWRSTAAITTIDLINDSGSFITGSTFNLYGIKAA